MENEFDGEGEKLVSQSIDLNEYELLEENLDEADSIPDVEELDIIKEWEEVDQLHSTESTEQEISSAVESVMTNIELSDDDENEVADSGSIDHNIDFNIESELADEIDEPKEEGKSEPEIAEAEPEVEAKEEVVKKAEASPKANDKSEAQPERKSSWLFSTKGIITIIACILTVFIGIGYGLMQALSIPESEMRYASATPEAQKPSFLSEVDEVEVVDVDEPALEGVEGFEFESEKVTNEDASVANTLASMQSEKQRLEGNVSRLNSEVKAKSNALSELEGRYTSLFEKSEKLIVKVSSLEAENKEKGSAIELLKQESKANSDLVINAKETISGLRMEVKEAEEKLERANIVIKKQDELSATYQKQMSSQIKDLKEALVDILEEKEKNSKRKNGLSQLEYTGIDMNQKSASYNVVKNGVIVDEITLKKDEPLLGRGIVENIDLYGCILFQDGTQYAPLNGFCK